MKAVNKSFVKKQILVSSIIAGVIAAISIYAACSLARCPSNLGKGYLAVIFFLLVFLLSYAIKKVLFLQSKLK